MGPSQGCKLHRRLYVPPAAPQGPWFERSGAFGRPRTPPRWCFAGHFSHAMLPISSVSRVRERRRRPHDPRPWAGGIVRGQHHVCPAGLPFGEFVKVPLRVVKVPPAAPERSAGYDASLGCPGAAPLLPGAPAIRRNSVTEAQLHRAVARARCRVQCHRAFQDYRWQQGRAMQIKRLTAGALALLVQRKRTIFLVREDVCIAAPASRQRAACPPLLRAGVRQLSP